MSAFINIFSMSEGDFLDIINNIVFRLDTMELFKIAIHEKYSPVQKNKFQSDLVDKNFDDEDIEWLKKVNIDPYITYP